MTLPELYSLETVQINAIRPHPQNYRRHPDDQLTHIMQSIQANGIYKNIVTAADGTILGGHGVVQAAIKLGYKEVPIIRLSLAADDPAAIKILLGDNEISNLADDDDRLLVQLLKDIQAREPAGLLGTGYDEKMLNLLSDITRPPDAITAFNPDDHWKGMPEYGETEVPLKTVVSFRNESDRAAFMKLVGATIVNGTNGSTQSIWYPQREREDLDSLFFDEKGVPE